MATNIYVLDFFEVSIARRDRVQQANNDFQQLSYLESLPAHVLGKIATQVYPFPWSLTPLLLASPVFLHKLRNGVQWKYLQDSQRSSMSLEEMRIVTLASVQTIKLLVINAKPPVEAGLRKFRRLLQSPSLEKVIVTGGTRCIEGEKISDSVS
jgi:hypothetical protein